MNIIALSKIKALDLPRVGHLGFVIKDIEVSQVVVHFTARVDRQIIGHTPPISITRDHPLLISVRW